MQDPSAPHLNVLDLAATRGDGVFETISVGGAAPQALEHHLRRFAASAAMLDLPAPDSATWRQAIRMVIAHLDSTSALTNGAEAWVKTVLTRGIEGDGRPTGWVYGTLSGDFSSERTTGIRVVTLDRGFRHDVAATSPWLLAGAKTLSYAVNRAVAREATRRDADDVLFVSSDGILLEGPTSTLITRTGDRLCTPGPDLGILDGTTQASIFRFAESRGMSTLSAHLSVDDLAASDAAWLVSSVRLAAPIRAIDGIPFAVDTDFSAAMNAFLLAQRE
jgi:4-amino-4-deoxychorismate lyase